MIRAAVLACILVPTALVAAPALAQTQTTLPEVRMLGTSGDGPPANYRVDIAPEYNGWIYQEIDGRGRPIDGSAPVTTTLYRGDGYPATIMVCPSIAPIRILTREQGETLVSNNRCVTVTTDHLRLATVNHLPDRRQVRYRILAIHRAAE
jgi:hypothetical protein